MAELLGVGNGRGRAPRLADVLPGDSAARLTATVRDLLRMDGRSASVEVTTVVHGRPERVWLHLLLSPPSLPERLLTAVGLRRVRHAALHAPIAAASGGGEVSPGRDELAERLGQALLRLRRRPSRLALAMVSVLRYTADGLRPAPLPVTVELAEHARRAARDTDTVLALGPGWLAVLAEDLAEGGEIAVARRVLAVLHRPGGDEPEPVVGVAVLEVTDPDADPDAVIDHLLQVESPAASAGGLTVLSPWDAAGRQADPAGADGRAGQRRRAALESGWFVLGRRSLRPLGSPDVSEPSAPRLALLEASTVDEGVLTPVRVDAPGLARALDRWLLQRVSTLPLPRDPEARLVLRLQPGGDLTTALGEGISALDHRFLVHVPEARLAEELSAQRAVLRELAARGVGLGVAGWSGRIDVPALVRWGICLVELAPTTQQAVLRPEGTALVAGLVAGLRAGLGDGATVLAEDVLDNETNKFVRACGVTWAISSRATIIVPR